MGHRRDTTGARIDRRDFMLRATTAPSAAGLAASLSNPAVAEGAPMAVLASEPKKHKTEQFTIHQDAPEILQRAGDPSARRGRRWFERR